MPRARDLLNRFRPSGTPGAAGVAGVPVDREAGPAAELASLLAALAPTERACASLLEQARTDAQAVRRRAEQEAASRVSAAREQQGAERAAVVAELRERRAADADATKAEAQRRAAAVREQADARMAGCVEDVVDAVRALVGGTG